MNLNSEIVYNERALARKKLCLLFVSLISIIWCTIWFVLFPIIRGESSVPLSLVITYEVINILFNLLGLLGVYKENYCLTMTYAILIALYILVSFVVLFTSIFTLIYINGLSLILNICIAICSFLYARGIRIVRNQRPTTPISTAIYPQQLQTIVQMAQRQQHSSPSNAWEPPPDYYSILSNECEPPPDYNSVLNTNEPNINLKMSVNQYYN